MKTTKFWAIMVPLLLVLWAAPSYGYYHPFSNQIEISEADDHPWGGELSAYSNDNGGSRFTGMLISAPAPGFELARIVPFFNLSRGITVFRSVLLNRYVRSQNNSTTSTINSSIIRRGN